MMVYQRRRETEREYQARLAAEKARAAEAARRYEEECLRFARANQEPPGCTNAVAHYGDQLDPAVTAECAKRDLESVRDHLRPAAAHAKQLQALYDRQPAALAAAEAEEQRAREAEKKATAEAKKQPPGGWAEEDEQKGQEAAAARKERLGAEAAAREQLRLQCEAKARTKAADDDDTRKENLACGDDA